MSSWHRWGVLLWGLAALAVAGCDKELSLTFVNHTARVAGRAED